MKEGLRLEELGEIPFDEKEILRYAMLPSFAAPPEELPLEECLKAAKGAAHCRAVWRRYPIRREEETLDLGFARTASRDLREQARVPFREGRGVPLRLVEEAVLSCG